MSIRYEMEGDAVCYSFRPSDEHHRLPVPNVFKACHIRDPEKPMKPKVVLSYANVRYCTLRVLVFHCRLSQINCHRLIMRARFRGLRSFLVPLTALPWLSPPNYQLISCRTLLASTGNAKFFLDVRMQGPHL